MYSTDFEHRLPTRFASLATRHFDKSRCPIKHTDFDCLSPTLMRGSRQNESQICLLLQAYFNTLGHHADYISFEVLENFLEFVHSNEATLLSSLSESFDTFFNLIC